MRRMIVSVVFAATVAVATPALASGSGTGGGASPRGFNSFDPALDQQIRLEQRGRAQVKKRITCKACEYKDGINPQNAATIAQAVRGGAFAIPEKDREAVLIYMKSRYGV